MNIFNLFKKKQRKEPTILIHSNSPNYPLKTIVEQDDSCTYMYLIYTDAAGQDRMKSSCWVRNHQKAPADIDLKTMQEGMPSMLPAEL